MDYKYIEQLLARYFEAETTLKEEQILKAFFAQDEDELPAAMRPYKSLFSAFDADDTLGSDFDGRILAMTGIEGGDAEKGDAVKARVISLTERLRPLLRAAAAVAVVVTMSTAINQTFSDENAWTDEEMVARYQDEMRRAAIAAATADSTTLYTEGIGESKSPLAESALTEMGADTLTADSMAGHIE